MPPLILALFDPTNLCSKLADGLGTSCLEHERRRFPDGETYLRIDGDVSDRDIIVFAALDQPDAKLAALLIAADTLKSLGAKTVTLIAPYLPYMRQDTRFREGEAVSSRTFANLISQRFDKLITIDPHLHRYKSLEDLYTCQTLRLTAAPLLGDWIKDNVAQPYFLIGPDSESYQWVSKVAGQIGAEFDVLKKTRHGDRDVDISPIATATSENITAILIDDTISTATTISGAARECQVSGYGAPICCAVHGIFAGNAEQELFLAGAARIITTNTIVHPSNAIDISALLLRALDDHSD